MSRLSEKLNTVRVAIYARVSTQHQIDKDSLPVQRESLVAYAKYVLNAKSYEIFEDAGYSGKNTDRPAYQKMIARIRKGEFSHLLVWKLDRISRNLLDFTAMYNELKQLGVTFVSKNEQFDTSSAIGEAMLKIILIFAELERKMTAERVSAVMIARAGNGQWNGGRIPYGYDYDKTTKTFSINKAEANIVLKIYTLYETYHSLIKVTKALNDSGKCTRRGKSWNPVSLNIILRNPFYIGVYRYNHCDMTRNSRQDVKSEKEWVVVENHHPAIIEKERWENILDMLDKNARGWKSTGKTYARANVHVFAGLLTCGCCGGNMTAGLKSRPNKNGYRPSYYACENRRKKSGCTNKYVSDKTIGPFVLNYIANMIKAKNSFGKSTTIETLQKKLLRGEYFKDVLCIKEHGLTELYNLYKSQINGLEYLTPTSSAMTNQEQERDVLLAEKRRAERAMARLQSLYLYSDEDMSEKDFISEKSKLDESLKKVNSRLDELNRDFSSEFSISDEELLNKASYFIISQKLADKRFVDYEKLIMLIEPVVLKNFINSVITNFCIKDGKITQITFKNGIIHEFIYKPEK